VLEGRAWCSRGEPGSGPVSGESLVQGPSVGRAWFSGESLVQGLFCSTGVHSAVVLLTLVASL
jgi:hypothetical protein